MGHRGVLPRHDDRHRLRRRPGRSASAPDRPTCWGWSCSPSACWSCGFAPGDAGARRRPVRAGLRRRRRAGDRLRRDRAGVRRRRATADVRHPLDRVGRARSRRTGAGGAGRGSRRLAVGVPRARARSSACAGVVGAARRCSASGRCDGRGHDARCRSSAAASSKRPRVAAGAALVVAGFTAGALAGSCPACVAGVLVGDRPAAAAHPARHPARRGRAAGGDRLTGGADVRLLRHRHVRAVRADQRPRHVEPRRQRRGHRGDRGVDVGGVGPATLDRTVRRGTGSCGSGYLLLVPGIAIVAVASIPDLLPFWFDPRRRGARRVRDGLRLFRARPVGTAQRARSRRWARPRRRCSSPTTSVSRSAPGAVGAIVAFGVDLGWPTGNAVAVALVLPAAVAAAGAVLSRRLPRRSDGSAAGSALVRLRLEAPRRCFSPPRSRSMNST